MCKSEMYSVIWFAVSFVLTKAVVVTDSTQPENVQISELNDGQLQVSWDPPSQPPYNVSRYDVDFKSENPNVRIVIMSNANVSSTRTWRLQFNTVYKITVLAVFTNGDNGTPSPAKEYKRVPATKYAPVGENGTSITLSGPTDRIWEAVRDTQHLFFVNGSEVYSNSLQPGKATVSVMQDNVTIVLSDIESADAGLYQSYFKRNERIEYVYSGTRLVVLGKPSKPAIAVTKQEKDDDVMLTLRCTSQSTTKPTQHGLNMAYEWRFNGGSVPSNGRYSVTDGTFIISKVIAADESNNVTCTAKEEKGLMSDPTAYRIPSIKDLTSVSPPLNATWMAISVCLLCALLFPRRFFCQ